jgi:hypothetical protein
VAVAATVCDGSRAVARGSPRFTAPPYPRPHAPSFPAAAAAAEGKAAKRPIRSQRTTRAAAAAADADAAASGDGAGGAGSSAATSATAAALTLTLPSGDIQSDLKDIYRDWKAAAQRWRSVAAATLTPVRVERGKLYYGSEAFAKGDSLAVFSELTKQEFYGSLHILAQVRAIHSWGRR